MLNLILFILISLSIANLIVREYVFTWLRSFINKWFPYSWLNKLIQCEICLSFWIGLALISVFPALLPAISSYLLVNMIFGGLVSSISTKIILMIIYKF